MSKHHEAKLAEGAMDNATLKMALDAAFAGVL
jgi:hypothetical protein